MVTNKWSSVALDESHEMCVNKDVKAAISKVTEDFIARITPYLPYRAKTLKNFRSELGFLSLEKSNSFLDHSDKLTEENIRMFVFAIKNSGLLKCGTSNRGLVNVNVFTGQVADNQQHHDMLNFSTAGEKELTAFIKPRILNMPSTNAPVRKKQLKMFSSASRRKSNVSNKADKDRKTLLSCLRKTIANCKSSGTPVPALLQFNELPRALCDAEGMPHKGSKANSIKYYKNRFKIITNTLPSDWNPDIVILEGMFLINSTPLHQHKTFLDYVNFLISRWIRPHLRNMSLKEIHALFDRQDIDISFSPKFFERSRRDENSTSHIDSAHFNDILDSTELPSNWRHFLANRVLKQKLINYLSNVFLSLIPDFLSESQSFCTAGGFAQERRGKTFSCTKTNILGNDNLKSDHEETESRVWFHAFKSNGKRILIFPPDTDTYHIGLSLIGKYHDKDVIVQLSNQLGKQSFVCSKKFVDCLNRDPDLAQADHESLPEIVQFLFIVSGCEYTSFFCWFW